MGSSPKVTKRRNRRPYAPSQCQAKACTQQSSQYVDLIAGQGRVSHFCLHHRDEYVRLLRGQKVEFADNYYVNEKTGVSWPRWRRDFREARFYWATKKGFHGA
jgi:hypothetical protein